VDSVSLTYNFREKTAFMDSVRYSNIELVEIHRVGVSGTLDLDGDIARLTFDQPVNTELINLNGKYALKITPAKATAPSPRRRKKRKAVEIAETWSPGAGISAVAERARSIVEPIRLEPMLLPRRTYEFPMAIRVAYDGAFHEIRVMFKEDMWMGEEKIKRKLKRAVFSNLTAPDLFVELMSAYRVGFLKISQGDFKVISYEKPFPMKIVGREATLG
jgi:hypothetical protein